MPGLPTSAIVCSVRFFFPVKEGVICLSKEAAVLSGNDSRPNFRDAAPGEILHARGM